MRKGIADLYRRSETSQVTHFGSDAMPGLDRRTLARWRAWWRSTFTG
jgi:hypothetical protein